MRVMSYNIRGGLGMDGRRSTARISDAVAEWLPDIVCFQEVHKRLPQSAFVDQPRRLEQALGIPLVFGANLHIGFGGYGLAIAARLPVLDVKNHRLPSVREQRGALQVALESSFGPLTVFCTHWGLNGEERERQAAALAEQIVSVPGPRIICGDLNEGAKAPAVRTLLALTGLRDADSGGNWLTYPADQPEARIDYILYSGTLRVEQVFAAATLASDHLPVIADFSAAR